MRPDGGRTRDRPDAPPWGPAGGQRFAVAGRRQVDRTGNEAPPVRRCAADPAKPGRRSSVNRRSNEGLSRRRVLGTGLGLVAGALLAACGQAAAPTAAPTTAPAAKPAEAPKPTEAPKAAEAAKPTEAPKPAAAEPTKP